MTPLVAEPVILRVVRLIEGVEQGFETSDGWFLREVAHVRTEGRYRRNSTGCRGESSFSSCRLTRLCITTPFPCCW